MILTKIKKHAMKMTKLILVTLLVSFSFSCSPEDGKDGATGPQGNANVIVSDWLQVEFDHVDSNNNYARMLIPIEDFETFLQNGGVVQMYIKQSVDGRQSVTYPLPFYDSSVINYSFAILNLDAIGQGIMFLANNPDVGQLENTPEFTIQYVLIPGNASARMNLNDSKMSYQELMKYLDIK